MKDEYKTIARAILQTNSTGEQNQLENMIAKALLEVERETEKRVRENLIDELSDLIAANELLDDVKQLGQIVKWIDSKNPFISPSERNEEVKEK